MTNYFYLSFSYLELCAALLHGGDVDDDNAVDDDHRAEDAASTQQSSHRSFTEQTHEAVNIFLFNVNYYSR